METAPVDVYVSGFVARCEVVRRPGQRVVHEPGVRGLLPLADDAFIRLLVTDDRSYDLVAALLLRVDAGMINVFAGADRCTALLAGHPAWRPEEVTAMVCRDLSVAPALRLPGELSFRTVRRLPDDASDGVPLEDVVAAAMMAAPAITGPPDAFGDYLRSLPAAIRLFVAVDGDGVVRATAGSGVFGREATVMLVNTHPDWRSRGVGQAMTAAALRIARDLGARRASLDASGPGTGIYTRLGFETVTRTTRFFGPG
jgi:GNAT superfamily N-acetyltransferase